MEYVLVFWPDSQEFMEEDWFDEEAILHIDEPSAYFIPKERFEEFYKQNVINN